MIALAQRDRPKTAEIPGHVCHSFDLIRGKASPSASGRRVQLNNIVHTRTVDSIFLRLRPLLMMCLIGQGHEDELYQVVCYGCPDECDG